VSQISIITAVVFIAAVLAAAALFWLADDVRKTRGSIGRRLAAATPQAKREEVLDALRRERGIVDHANPALRGLNDLLVQTGLRLDRRRLTFYAFGLGAVLFFAFGGFVGHGIMALVLAVGTAPTLIAFYLRGVRRRRIARFAEQLPDAIDVIARGLRVGYPLATALDLVAREMPDPIGPEFGMTVDEISFGQDLRVAMSNLYRRVGQDDLQFVIVAVSVQSQTGGNLAEILSRLARLVRSRAKLALKIRALSAEGRISARFLSLMPFFLVGIISLISPSFFAEVRHSEAIEPALIYAAISLLLGNLIMYRMVNFKF
jgi:tight adherence protein B